MFTNKAELCLCLWFSHFSASGSLDCFVMVQEIYQKKINKISNMVLPSLITLKSIVTNKTELLFAIQYISYFLREHSPSVFE